MEKGTGAAKKLGIRPGARVTILGMEPDAAAVLIGEMPDGVTVTGDSEPSDIVLLFAEDLGAVRRDITAAHQRLTAKGRLWIAYRKGQSRQPGSDAGTVLHRDTLQQALGDHGFVGVSLIAIDDIWSAMRVRPVA